MAAFNKEKALVGAFSVIVKTGFGTDGSFYSTTYNTMRQSGSHIISTTWVRSVLHLPSPSSDTDKLLNFHSSRN